MVPLQNTHSTNGIIEPDRMLMVSGSLSDSTFGSASSVLFDGKTFIPYFASISAQGAFGFVSALVYSIANFSFVQQRTFTTRGLICLWLKSSGRFPGHGCCHPNCYRHRSWCCLSSSAHRDCMDSLIQKRRKSRQI